ncbi:hypothetical protein [Nannocystis pusilla]|uniref:hypothetical protein n=1 Tax=Nannocystis pusilla TaxID=889268 RepID=UPI003DA24C7A
MSTAAIVGVPDAKSTKYTPRPLSTSPLPWNSSAAIAVESIAAREEPFVNRSLDREQFSVPSLVI